MAKVAIITGASRRIGAVIATHLHQQGYNVAIHYRHSAADAQALCHALNQQRIDSAITVSADLNQLDTVQAMIEQVHQALGRIDVVINNASSFYATPMGHVTSEQWDDLFNSNAKGAFFLAQYAHPYLQQQQGCIINIADIHGEKPLKNYAVYSMAKAALIMMTKSLAKEFAPDVRVNAVAPGNIAWPEGENTLNAEQQAEIIDKIPLHRQGTPQDIAQAVDYLIHAPYVTGRLIAVDGGRGA